MNILIAVECCHTLKIVTLVVCDNHNLLLKCIQDL